MLHKPLYCVSIGELGVTPQELENNLRDILDVCETWDALILLDEADVFVAKRAKGEILPNSMVGVILRLTEYYRGILFFTSNRVTSFDPGFLSRVTVTLRYSQLDAQGRSEVWRILQKKSGVNDVGVFDIGKLKEYVLNGRQIKNALALSKV